MYAYDEVPYASQAFAQTHPDRLATTARLFGLAPPPIERCRVLELGCAAGGNLIPMAYALPGSEFVGVDLSARQVQDGQARIQAMGLRNVRIEHASITDVDAGWGRFDYMICHGVFSWVETPVQEKILQIAAEQLSDAGVAYISYNTYPGWHMRESVRHMMRYHAMPFDSPQERIQQARALLDFLAGAVPPDSGAYGQMLNSELELLRQCADWYLFHEHLEPTNTPMYFHQFIERAGRHGLQFLAEADFATMLAARFSPQVAQTLDRISADIIHLEQYMDFVRNRHFRQTLLCKQGVVPKRALSPAVIDGLYVASAAQRQDDDAGMLDLRPGVEATFRIKGRSQAKTAHPVSKAAFELLSEHWPRGWAAHALVDAAFERAAAHVQPEQQRADRAVLMQDLFQCFLSGLVELRSAQPACAAEISAAPQASAWARQEAAQRGVVTGLRHEVVSLAPFSRELLGLLDGRHDHAALLAAMQKAVDEGRVPLPPGAADVGQALEQSLASLARHALLVL